LAMVGVFVALAWVATAIEPSHPVPLTSCTSSQMPCDDAESRSQRTALSTVLEPPNHLFDGSPLADVLGHKPAKDAPASNPLQWPTQEPSPAALVPTSNGSETESNVTGSAPVVVVEPTAPADPVPVLLPPTNKSEIKPKKGAPYPMDGSAPMPDGATPMPDMGTPKNTDGTPKRSEQKPKIKPELGAPKPTNTAKPEATSERSAPEATVRSEPAGHPEAEAKPELELPDVDWSQWTALIVSTVSFTCSLNNWLHHARAVSQVHVTVAGFDPADKPLSTAQRLAFEEEVASVGNMAPVRWVRQQGNEDFWKWRLGVLSDMLSSRQERRYVLLCDADAIWMRDPVPTLSAVHAAHGFDVVSSTGVFPFHVRDTWEQLFGFHKTLCAGFISFGGARAARFVAALHEQCEALTEAHSTRHGCDDQAAMNGMLLDNKVHWQTYPDTLRPAGFALCRAGSVGVGDGAINIAALKEDVAYRPLWWQHNGRPNALVVHPFVRHNATLIVANHRLWNQSMNCVPTQDPVVRRIDDQAWWTVDEWTAWRNQEQRAERGRDRQGSDI